MNENNMQYIISEIKSVADSNYPDSKKYTFRVEGNDKDISAFSKFPMTVGQEINGDIVPNGAWLNFKWGSKASTPAPSTEWQDKMYREIYAIRQEQVLVRQLLQANGSIPPPTTSAYPEHTPTAFDEKVEDTDLPF